MRLVMPVPEAGAGCFRQVRGVPEKKWATFEMYSGRIDRIAMNSSSYSEPLRYWSYLLNLVASEICAFFVRRAKKIENSSSL
jgi:hypothetical protein